MRAALIIAWKDLRQRARDRSVFLMAIVVPLFLAFIFSQIFSGVSGDSVTFDYAVVDQDGGDIARVLVDEVLVSLEEDGLIKLTVAKSLEHGRRLAEDGDVSATFVIPPGFTDAVGLGQRAEIQVIGNVDAEIGTLVASAVAGSFAAELTAAQIAVAAVLGEGADPDAITELAQKATEIPNAISVRDVSADEKQLDPGTFYSAGMAVFFLFFSVQFGIASLLDERREGTLSRLLAAPIPHWSILVGKFLTSLVIGVVSMVVLVVATSVLLGAEWGNPAGVALLVLVGVLSAMAVMALIATLARTSEQTGNYQAIVALVLGMLGGAFFPVAQAGGVIERLSLLTPHAWFLRGLSELQGGGGLVDILPAIGAILAFAAVVGAVALTRVRRLVQP